MAGKGGPEPRTPRSDAEAAWRAATEAHRECMGEPCPHCGALARELTGFTGHGELVYTCRECGRKVRR